MAYTLEELERLTQLLNNGNQKRQEEIAKQTNAAPVYGNKLPTLDDISRRKAETDPQYANQLQIQQRVNEKKADIAKSLDEVVNNTTFNNQADKFFNQSDSKRDNLVNNRKNEKQFIKEMTSQGYTEKQAKSYLKEYKANNNVNKSDYLVPRERYNEMMQDGRLANDIAPLAQALMPVNSKGHDLGVRAINDMGYKSTSEYLDQLSRRYNLTTDELKDIVKTYQSDKTRAQEQKAAESTYDFAQNHPVLGSGLSLASDIGSAVEGGYNVLAGGLTGDERNLSNMFNTLRTAPRQGVADNMEYMGGVYQMGMGLGDLGVGVLTGNPALMMAGDTANSAVLDAVNRGVNARDAGFYGAGAGIVDYITNKIGLDAAKERAIKSIESSGMKKVLAQNAYAGLGEAGENIIQDVAQSFLDELINGQNSELNTLYNEKIASGMTEDEALGEVAKEYAGQLAMSAGTGFLMGSAMQGGKTILDNARAGYFNRQLERSGETVRKLADEYAQKNNAAREAADLETLAKANEDIDSLVNDIPVLEKITEQNVNNPEPTRADDVTDAIRNGEITEPDGFVPQSYKVSRGVDSIPENEYKSIYRKSGKNTVINDGTNYRPFIDNAIDNASKGTNNSFYLGKVSSELGNDLKASLGEDFTNNHILIDESHIQHMNNKHGENSEAAENGEVPISRDDIESALEAFNKPDLTYWIEDNNIKQRQFKVQKRIDGYIYTVFAVKNGNSTNGDIQIVDMYKSPTALNNGYNPSLNLTSENGQLLDSNNTISQNGDVVNTEGANQPTSEAASSMPESSINPDDYTVITVHNKKGEERFVIKKGTEDANSYSKEFGRKQYKTKEEAETAIRDRASVEETPIENTSMPEAEEAPQADIPTEETSSEINPNDYVVQKIRYKGQERYQILKDLHDDNPLNRAPEFGNLIYKSEESARKAIKKYIKQASTVEETPVETPVEAPVDTPVEANEAPVETSEALTEAEATPVEETSQGTPGEVGSLITRRSELLAELDRKGVSINDMAKSMKELNAVNDRIAELRPEMFKDGKFVKQELQFNLQTFAAAKERKEELQVRLADKGVKLAERRRINDEINEIDNAMKGLRKTITNTAVKAGIVPADEIANDPELKSIAEYVRHSNEIVLAQAKANLEENGEQIKNDYVSGKKQINTDLDADQSMQLLEGEYGDLDSYERNSILKNLAENGTVAGQFIQALAKYSNTMQGALINATNVIRNETEYWAGRHRTEVGRNSKLAEALKRQGYDGTINITKPELTFDELRQQVRNTLAEEYSSIESQFSDGDIDYLAHMIEHNASIDDLVDALNTKMATGSFGISDETMSEVNNLFEYAKQFDENSSEYVEAQAEAFRLLAEEVAPNATPFEKFDAWRYMAMLGNPKTMLRNYIGNKMFSAITGVSNNLAAIAEGGVDAAIKGGKKVSNKLFNTNFDSNYGIERTKSVLNPIADRALLQATKADAYDKRYRQIEGSKYEKMDKDALRRSRSVFNSGLMRLMEEAVDKGISDTKAVASKYSTSMAGYMKANGLTEADLNDSYRFDELDRKSKSQLLSKEERAEMDSLRDNANKVEKARDYALKQAEYATFHEDNAIADAISRLSRKNTAAKIIVEGLVPFKKTPANIIRSGVEYSPLGALKSIAQTGKLVYENTGKRRTNLGDTYEVRNPLTHGYKEVNRTLASDVIQSWSQTLTGSALASLGYYLYNKGILHSSTDDEKYQDELEGKQNYSIEINGKTYTIDWAVPGSMPLLLGAEISKAFEANAISDEKWYNNVDALFGTLDGLFEPIIETSMLQGVSNTVDTFSNRYDDAGRVERILNAGATLGVNYLTQAIPTLSGQIARTVDNTRRSTDTVNEGLVGNMEKQGRKVMNKIPGLSKRNQPYINARGEEQRNAPYDNIAQRLAYQTLSPWYAQEIDTRPSDEIARNAYNGIGENDKPVMDKAVFADWASKVTINGEKLNPEQMHDYREAAYTANTEIREELADAKWFNDLSPEKQTEILKSTNTLADHIGKAAAVDDYTTGSEMYEAYEKGGIDGVLDKYESDMHKAEVKEELGTSADWAMDLYDNGSSKDLRNFKKASNYASKKGVDMTKSLWNTYNEEGEEAFKEAVKYGKLADEAGVTDSKAFREAIDSGVSAKDIQKTSESLDDYGLTKQSASYTYEKATSVIPSLTTKEFANTYKQIDSNGNQGITQDELIDYFNRNHFSQAKADQYWAAYGSSSWKKVPKLDGTSFKKAAK